MSRAEKPGQSLAAFVAENPAEPPEPAPSASVDPPVRVPPITFRDLASMAEDAREAVDRVMVAASEIRGEVRCIENEDLSLAALRIYMVPYTYSKLDLIYEQVALCLDSLLVLQDDLLDRWRDGLQPLQPETEEANATP